MASVYLGVPVLNQGGGSSTNNKDNRKSNEAGGGAGVHSVYLSPGGYQSSDRNVNQGGVGSGPFNLQKGSSSAKSNYLSPTIAKAHEVSGYAGIQGTDSKGGTNGSASNSSGSNGASGGIGGNSNSIYLSSTIGKGQRSSGFAGGSSGGQSKDHKNSGGNCANGSCYFSPSIAYAQGNSKYADEYFTQTRGNLNGNNPSSNNTPQGNTLLSREKQDAHLVTSRSNFKKQENGQNKDDDDDNNNDDDNKYVMLPGEGPDKSKVKKGAVTTQNESLMGPDGGVNGSKIKKKKKKKKNRDNKVAVHIVYEEEEE